MMVRATTPRAESVTAVVETKEGSGAQTDPVGRVAPLDWATDVIAAGAGTAPRLNTARRDKGGVTHFCLRHS